MIGYLIRRVVQAVIVIIGVCAITFGLYHLFPGGANAEARVILGPRATRGAVALFLQQNGLNKPIWTQFFVLVGHVFTFNLGYSYKLNEPVATVVLQKLPKTVLLLGLSTLLTVVIAIPLGIFQVLRRNKPSDYALTTLSFIFYATPTFFLGIVLIEVFAIHLHIFPAEAPQ
jgi:peptide/nickel transport system permease protein